MRKRFLQLCKKLEYRFVFIYTWLLRSSFKSCGDDVRIHFPVRLEHPEMVTLGDGVMIYARSWLNVVRAWGESSHNGELRIGKGVGLGYGVHISAAQSIVIEDDVCISEGSVVVDHLHDHHYVDMPVFRSPLSPPQPVRIGRGSFLGVHCFVGPGVQIGEHAVVAANAVVINDVPAYAMAIGNPARAVRFHHPESEKTLESKSC